MKQYDSLNSAEISREIENLQERLIELAKHKQKDIRNRKPIHRRKVKFFYFRLEFLYKETNCILFIFYVSQ